MPTVFNALPGTEVPVGSIAQSLEKIWTDAAACGRPSPSKDDTKATQINLVLHLGFGTTPEDGAAQFQSAVRFSRRYPCRVVVLCPLRIDDISTDIMRAKIYGECHLGKSQDDTRCCEFVMLSYPMSARQYLESQVSICLSTDLPLYYWVHRFASAARLNDYQYLLRRSKRIILDSAIIPEGFGAYAWPQPEAMRDLALARLLPVRQKIGQFLSACAPAELVANLVGVRAAHDATLHAEASALLDWTRERLRACGMAETVRFVCAPAAPGQATLSLDFEYETTDRAFHWEGLLTGQRTGISRIDADLCHGPVKVETPLCLLAPEAALAEAMFF